MRIQICVSFLFQSVVILLSLERLIPAASASRHWFQSLVHALLHLCLSLHSLGDVVLLNPEENLVKADDSCRLFLDILSLEHLQVLHFLDARARNTVIIEALERLRH